MNIEHFLGELGNRMGMEILELDASEVVVRLPVLGNRQPIGLLHGGANGVLVEHAASVLALLNAPDGKTAVGTELNVSQLKSALEGHVTARATIISRARSSICSNVEIRDDDGVLTAVGRMTNVFITPEGKLAG